jgi:hypothetical protein
MDQLAVDDWDGGHYGVVVDKKPDQCEICHHAIEPIYKHGVIARPLSVKDVKDNYLQAVFVCPRRDCHRVLIAYYTQFAVERDKKGQFGPPFKLQDVKPRSFKAKEFPATITEVSPLFCTIYNEAAQGEDLKLFNIAGSGYRKRLNSSSRTS